MKKKKYKNIIKIYLKNTICFNLHQCILINIFNLNYK